MPAADDVVSSQAVIALNSKLPYTATIPNLWSAIEPTFRFGAADEKGPRRTMEDAHTYVFDFAGIHGQGFFAVFDGHAGKEAADWCAKNFHEHLLQALSARADPPIPDILNEAFQSVDRSLMKMSEDSDGKMHSGCTAVTALLRIEDADGRQPFATTLTSSSPVATIHSSLDESSDSATSPSPSEQTLGTGARKGSSQSRLKKAIKRLSQHISGHSPSVTPRTQSPTRPIHMHAVPTSSYPAEPQYPLPGQQLRRVLYVANAGDARGVLCRGGRALRLSYDHKGTDKQEAKRIMDSGGFVLSGRVNGVLAVTRSLGDPSMKEFVVGAPYTTETELTDEDECLILACDGIWDVLDDQMAVEIVRPIQDAQKAAEKLIHEATQRYTNDNITVMVIRLKDVTPELLATIEK
ncbi:protein serine/threonine phosphatase 2C [Vararia minispora EC-137]|uniref:Protein serine/threonine phosphatase 2C n=1 Tax=Vararia minispora EC-137 TaxID=1314806 RepID=A0ACB8Q808_9AGAM|nr:protein serine/threonine phosphatase 2C [Vararia minispora EC-137]